MILLLGIALLVSSEALILFTRNAPSTDEFAVGVRGIFKYVVRPVALLLIPVGALVALLR